MEQLEAVKVVAFEIVAESVVPVAEGCFVAVEQEGAALAGCCFVGRPEIVVEELNSVPVLLLDLLPIGVLEHHLLALVTRLVAKGGI